MKGTNQKYEKDKTKELCSEKYSIVEQRYELSISCTPLERWFSVSYPFKSSQICTVRLAIRITGVTCAICLLIGLPQMVFYEYDEKNGCSML